MQCQIDCQAKGFVDCQANLQGGCEVQCDQPEGSIFCNGEYVDHGGHAQECIDALNAYLKAHVDVSATGSCSGNTCQGEVHAKASCSATPAGTESGTKGALAVASFLGLSILARRRARP